MTISLLLRFTYDRSRIESESTITNLKAQARAWAED